MKIVRGLFLCLLLVLPAADIFAQKTGSPLLEVIQKKWHFRVRNPALEEDPFRANDEMNPIQSAPILTGNNSASGKELPQIRTRSEKEMRVLPASTVFIYELKIKNTGQKEIQAVTWDYVFLDPGTKAELGRRRFLSRAGIGTGKIKNLIIHSPAPPTRVVTVDRSGKLNNPYTEQIVIQKIVYKDGSIWNS